MGLDYTLMSIFPRDMQQEILVMANAYGYEDMT